MYPAARVNRKAADRVASGHPWIYSSDVSSRGEAQPGDVVQVLDPWGKALGIAHYSSSSQIALRMLSPRAETVDRGFWLGRLAAAKAFRERVVKDSTACRIVHAEADFLPALIVDRYADCVVIQTLNQGMERAKDDIVSCLEELFQPLAIVERNDAPVRRREELEIASSVLRGSLPPEVVVEMNGLRFRADLLKGQKTGLFLDQRENYRAAARWARGRGLDLFCSSSAGFALHMARHSESVEAVDSSEAALELAQANRDLNGIPNVSFREADVFDLLAGYSAAAKRFDTIVLDPPAFAKTRGQLEGAARGYTEINRRAIGLLAPGGVLITCSCSHHLSEAVLLEAVASAALDAGRTLRVLERRTQAQDHPILLTVPETHYLKCLVLEAAA